MEQTQGTETQIPEEQEQEELKKPEPIHKKQFSAIMEIRKRERNPLLDREDIKAIVRSSITPSEQQAKQLLASELKVPEELIVIRNIYSTFGKQEFKINAYLYSNKETLQKLARREKKEKKEEKEKSGEKQKEEKAEEKTEEKVTKEEKAE